MAWKWRPLMLLEVEHLDVRYGRIRAVRDVSVTVEAGEVVTIVGANGAGKSSLLRAIAGLNRIAGGSIRFDGAQIDGLSTPARVQRGLVLVPEGRQIFVSLTVNDNLLLGAHGRHDADVGHDIDRIYQRFSNLADRRNMRASVLSGGEQQMLAIGRALVARPRLIMMDEPSLGLSPLLVSRLFDLIGELNRDGLAILLVEQNTHMALDAASRGYVLELGTVALQGDARTLAADPALAAAYLGS
jgi:branched-chain amino acid transport system ATP-binding protein